MVGHHSELKIIKIARLLHPYFKILKIKSSILSGTSFLIKANEAAYIYKRRRQPSGWGVS